MKKKYLSPALADGLSYLPNFNFWPQQIRVPVAMFFPEPGNADALWGHLLNINKN
jgi:hypothetical protein